MRNPLVPPVVGEGPRLRSLRAEVRAFTAEQAAAGTFVPRVDTWLTSWDREFTRELGRRGWLGMVVPKEYGGQGRTFLERFVVTEELLASGAPVAAHWIAERQVGPSLLRFGSEQVKQTFLPRISRGEVLFGIGMSEPESGSDLASVQTRATRCEGGWRLTGTKVWTSGAHRADWFIVLARSAPLDERARHAGLSQFLVDLGSDGVTVAPIVSMSGEHHFNEVHLDDVFVPDDLVLGQAGDGWLQVTSELGYERSGPERILSTWALLAAATGCVESGALPQDPQLGRLVGRVAALRQMSLAVSNALEARQDADTAAAVVKLLGTTTEGDIAEYVATLAANGGLDEGVRVLLDAALLQRPGYTLRGGTNEILTGVVARGLGLR
ncbi:acyl-CoA dehydrogenase family protein [Streptomyces sp. NPDC050388]|uniref:acyl-CoA dehydrogenase family protein n=1 Tax=Streptomyces sp. NPDC050388 TaxID=3155781 RepID=UPI00343A0ECA